MVDLGDCQNGIQLAGGCPNAAWTFLGNEQADLDHPKRSQQDRPKTSSSVPARALGCLRKTWEELADEPVVADMTMRPLDRQNAGSTFMTLRMQHLTHAKMKHDLCHHASLILSAALRKVVADMASGPGWIRIFSVQRRFRQIGKNFFCY